MRQLLPYPGSVHPLESRIDPTICSYFEDPKTHVWARTWRSNFLRKPIVTRPNTSEWRNRVIMWSRNSRSLWWGFYGALVIRSMCNRRLRSLSPTRSPLNIISKYRLDRPVESRSHPFSPQDRWGLLFSCPCHLELYSVPGFWYCFAASCSSQSYRPRGSRLIWWPHAVDATNATSSAKANALMRTSPS